MPLVEIKNLVQHYGPIRAVDDLSFSVEAGTITGSLGPNGSGKTTTLRALLGLLMAPSALFHARTEIRLGSSKCLHRDVLGSWGC